MTEFVLCFFDIHRLHASIWFHFSTSGICCRARLDCVWSSRAIPRFINRTLSWMELASSKLRLAASVSSDISIKGSHLKKRQIIFIVVFVGLISASGGFLLGYFLKGNKTNNEEAGSATTSNNDQPSRYRFNVSKTFIQFEEEVSASELRENLRWVDALGISDGIYSNYIKKKNKIINDKLFLHTFAAPFVGFTSLNLPWLVLSFWIVFCLFCFLDKKNHYENVGWAKENIC